MSISIGHERDGCESALPTSLPPHHCAGPNKLTGRPLAIFFLGGLPVSLFGPAQWCGGEEVGRAVANEGFEEICSNLPLHPAAIGLHRSYYNSKTAIRPQINVEWQSTWHTRRLTRNLFYKGQGDFQVVLSLENFPKLTSCVPFVSLIFSAMFLAFWFWWRPFIKYGFTTSLSSTFCPLISAVRLVWSLIYFRISTSLTFCPL